MNVHFSMNVIMMSVNCWARDAEGSDSVQYQLLAFGSDSKMAATANIIQYMNDYNSASFTDLELQVIVIVDSHGQHIL